MGLLKFTPPPWTAVEFSLNTLDPATRDRLDMTGLLRRLLTNNTFLISTLATDGQWGEIDSPEDVALYNNMVREGALVLEDTQPLSDRVGRSAEALPGGTFQ